MQLSIYGAVATATVDTKSIWWEQVRTTNKIAYVRLTLFPNTYCYVFGGNKWTRTTDLTLIRRVL